MTAGLGPGMSKVKAAKVRSLGGQSLAVQGRDPRASGFQGVSLALHVSRVSWCGGVGPCDH